MDAVVYTALEEICSQGSTGIPLRTLWSKINHNLQINGLNLCNNVKKAIWLNLLNIPSLNFECNGVLFDSGNPKIQMVDECEAMDLKIVAKECLLNNFVGIYDIKASDAGVSQPQRRTLERLAIARTDGITQNELAKEFDIENKNIFYILRNLESRGLIVRQSTIIRKKEAGNEEYKNGSIINTNMLHLYRYAKHLGHLQRLEITKGDNSSINDDNAGREIAIKDGVSKERIEDFVPAITAICDRLEKADGKVLVVSDLKIELGYRKTRGHRTWRNILQKLKDANLVEEFFATVNNKPVSCVRLLKKFSPTTCASKSHGGGDDDLDTENVKLVKRGQITDQLFELPIEQQIYDMIDAEGSKGLILNDVYKRLAINNKRYYHRILDMVSRFGMHLDSEGLNKGVVYRVWTSGNFNKKVPNIPPTDEKLSIHAETGQLMLTHTVHDVDEEQVINPISSTNDTWLDSNNLQCEASDVITDAEHQIVTVKPVSDSVSLEISSSASPIRRIRRSYTTYPCLGLNLVTSQREQRILEKLQEDKVLLKPELRRLLESLENKHTEMDKRTLERILNKLQKEGHCKCISFTVPSITNCSRTRTVDVILHPSVYKANDLSDRVHEKLRSFDWQLRDQSYSRYKLGKCKPIPVLNDVERISTSVKIDVQSKTHEAMKNNGFVLAKMVRAKLLHVFLWGYLTVLPSWDDEQKNPHSSCKLLELDAAIKVMPLELFLQVAGSTLQLESMVEKCKNGIRLSDLSIQEYRSLMDTRATARLSYLIDILRRLKLIRLIGGSVPVGPHTTLRHSLELKPYIEEPVGMILPSTGVSSDLRPHHRHDFVLATRKSVDEYWNTLEYCYAASDPKAALHAFPGSAVVEVFHARSWASVRVMTAHQRAELVKIVANDDSDKKITYKKCEKIAENLNLTLEQVLRVYYDKREKDKSKREKDKSKRACKRKRSSKHKSLNNEKTEITLEEEESGKNKHAKLLGPEDDATEEQNSSQRLLEYNETSMFTDEIDGQKDVVNDDHEIIEDMHKCALPKLNCSRQKRFLWTENHDRQLVIEYVKHRVVLGAKFHRTDWASIENLPGPPNTCRRRVSTLRKNIQFKKALLGLCNMLSVRYAKHLETSKNKSVVGDYRMITNDLNIEERWDDFENNDIRMILDEVFKYKQVAKSEVTKDAQYVSKYPKSNVVVGAEGHELDENNLCSSSTHMNELNKDGRKRKASVRRSRKRLPKSCLMIMNKVKDFGTQVYKSLAVSNAIELFKLIFLSTAKAPEIPNLLAETLRRYSEHDLFTAFNYLRDKSFMVRGNDISHFVLSQPFLHSISSSPFPVNTGKRADKMSNWLHENENDLLETGLDLSADLQCGDVLQLCVLMCNGEISIFSCLPDEGVGEIDDLKKRKCDEIEVCSVEIASKKPKLSDNEIFSRKEKGFPGIQLSITRSLISRDDTITLSSYNSSSSKRVEGIIMSNDASESTWESMTFYARNLTSSTQEQSLLNPTLFKTVYSAIKNAGDQGLSVEGISQIIDMQGEDNAELIVEVLEAFGRVLKVNAYDSVNVVESLYRSKYRLTSMAIHHHKLPENNEENNEKNLISESPKTADVVEVHASTNEVHHRVTILNHTEEASQPINEVESNNEIEIMSPKTGPQEEEKCEFRVGEYSCFKPILPWVNGDGTVNKIVYKGLVRRVLGIVMQNPGILEEHVSSQMDVLNPQSCKRLLELMILDSLITVRKMYESVSHEPPAILGTLLGCNLKKPKMVCKEHLFANPNSIGYL